MPNGVKRFIVVDELFSRYTVVVDIDERTTSVYCTECEEWVVQWDGEQVSRHTQADLFESITEIHRNQVVGHPVEISDTSKDLSTWLDK